VNWWLAALVVYLITFSLSGGNVTINTPLVVQAVTTTSSYVAFVNVSSPVYLPVLAILPQNASVWLSINSTGILLQIASATNWSVSLWSLSQPYEVIGASYTYNPYTGNITVSGSGNATVFIGIAFGNVVFKKVYFDPVLIHVPDILLAFAILLMYVLGGYALFRKGTLHFVIRVIIGILASIAGIAVRTTITVGYITVGTVTHYIVQYNPVSIIYPPLLTFGLVLLILGLLWRSSKRVIAFI